MIEKYLNKKILSKMEKNQKLFIVDLETVSIFPPENLENLANNNERYLKTPFLYLISSYVRNRSLDWASENLTYQNKMNLGAWNVYCFKK